MSSIKAVRTQALVAYAVFLRIEPCDSLEAHDGGLCDDCPDFRVLLGMRDLSGKATIPVPECRR